MRLFLYLQYIYYIFTSGLQEGSAGHVISRGLSFFSPPRRHLVVQCACATVLNPLLPETT